MGGLAVQPGTGNLYAAQGNQSPKGFYLLNKFTAAATLLGSTGNAISGMNFNSAGVLYGWSQLPTKQLVTLNIANGTVAGLGTNISNATNACVAFSSSGNLYLVRGGNAIYQINPANGNSIGVLKVISGATSSIDNILARNAAGTMFTGERSGGVTKVYQIDPTTGVTALAFTASAGFSGIAFDDAAAPAVTVSGKKRLKTKKPTATIKGGGVSVLPLTVSAKGARTVKVTGGKWTLKVKLKRGKNVVVIKCADGFGQLAQARVTIIRS